MHAMIRRRDAAQAAVARFRDARFAWGVNDCARLAAFTLRKLGYRPPMPRAGSYRTLLAARKALKAAGFADLPDALDALALPRLTLAYALPGDVVAVPGEEGLTALWISVGNGRVLGWHQDSELCSIIQPTFADAVVWRADPRG